MSCEVLESAARVIDAAEHIINIQIPITSLHLFLPPSLSLFLSLCMGVAHNWIWTTLGSSIPRLSNTASADVWMMLALAPDFVPKARFPLPELTARVDG